MKIFSGSSNLPLAKAINQQIIQRIIEEGVRNGQLFDLKNLLGEVELHRFPDGEVHVRFCENIRGEDIYLIQSTNSPVNDNLMELLIMVDAAKRASAERITAVMPFFGYARQDRKEKSRVPITAKLVANILTAAGVDRILAMDLHSPQIEGFFDIPVDHLQAIPVFMKEVKFLTNLENIVSVAPDVGRIKVAVQYAKQFGCQFAMVAKDRIDDKTVESNTLVGDVDGKTAILIDDMSSTGGTLIAAAALLKKRGAKKVIAGVTHNLLTNKAWAKIDADPNIDLLMVTDTVDGSTGMKTMKVSVASLFAQAIMAINSNQSVSHLLS